jgi:hypothetical protein
MSEDMIKCGVYRHYKGGFYQVLGVARHSETDELMVVYVSLNGAHLSGPRMSVRPLMGPEGFLTPVELESGRVLRFTYIGIEIPADLRPHE